MQKIRNHLLALQKKPLGCFQMLLALFLFLHYFTLMGESSYYFLDLQMLNRNLFGNKGYSLFWHVTNPILIKFFLLVSLSLCGLVFLDLGKRWTVLLLLIVHISFISLNPLIVHEPQQLATLFLVWLLLSPTSYNRQYIGVMVTGLALYYLISVFKKLPDEHWLDGTAVGLLASWPGLSKGTWLNSFLSETSWMSSLATWFTLIFELAFVVIVWTRWRKILLIIGLLFHWSLSLLLDVGLFPLIMTCWYGAAWELSRTRPRSDDTPSQS